MPILMGISTSVTGGLYFVMCTHNSVNFDDLTFTKYFVKKYIDVDLNNDRL